MPTSESNETINIIRSLIKKANRFDSSGNFKKADRLFIKLSQYYVEQSITKVPSVQYFEMDDIDDEYKENEFNYRTKKPNLRVPEYHDLGVGKDEENLEGKLHGPDSVPGPAYVDPGNLASSPSMAGDVDCFTWEETYEKNVEEGNGWKNRIPLR